MRSGGKRLRAAQTLRRTPVSARRHARGIAAAIGTGAVI